MGLEGVSIVLACEERFGIALDDTDVEGCATIGDLQDLVVRHTLDGNQQACLTSHVFYRLRSGLTQDSSGPGRRIRPDTLLEQLFPAESRRDEWSRLAAVTGLQLPDLAAPGWAVYIGLMLLVPIPFGVVATPWIASIPLRYSVAVTIVGVGLLVIWGASAHGRELPADVRTVRDLVVRAASLNYSELKQNNRMAGEGEVRAFVLDIVAEELGLSAAELTPGMEFGRDLGL